jgi:hypothetical protein
MIHRHNWNLISKDRIEGKTLTNMKTYSTEDTALMLDAMRDKMVYVWKCECGKVKVIKK